MVSQVGLGTSYAGYNNLGSLSLDTTLTKSNPLNFSPMANGYADDMMMSNLDFGAIAASYNQQNGVPQTQQVASQQQTTQQPVTEQYSQQVSQQQQLAATNPSFNGKGQQQSQYQQVGDPNFSELNGYLASQIPDGYERTENGNVYKKSNNAKTAGLVLGALAPASGKIVNFFKGGNFVKLFKSKQLAIACPVVALGGWIVGALLDNNINANRAKKADTLAFAQQSQALNTRA